MTKRIASLFVLTMLLVAMIAMVAEASRVQDEWAEKLKVYSIHPTSPDDPQNAPSRLGTATTSLGSDGPDGTSPGSIVFRSHHDHPQWYDGGHLIDWRASAQLHMVFINQAVGGVDRTIFGRWPHYNMFDATISPNGAFVSGTAGVPILSTPMAFTGEYPQLDVDNSGRAMPAMHTFVPTAPGATSNPRNVSVFWDIGSYTFDADTLPQSLSGDPLESIGYPKIEYQLWDGIWITHLICTEWDPVYAQTYWRRVGGLGTYQGWTNPLRLEGVTNGKIAAQRTGPNVALFYIDQVDVVGAPVLDSVTASSPHFIISTDRGESWGTGEGTPIINYVAGEDNWSSWVDLQGIYDAEGHLHIVYNTMVWDGETLAYVNSVNPTRIFHWTNRVSGPNGGGKLSVVQHVEMIPWGLQCGRGWTNETNTARAVMSECNGRMYVVWMQFADTETLDTGDCTDTELRGFVGSSNSELYMSVSLGLEGSLWDRRRNITNSHSPGCTGELNNECDHDSYPSLSRLGMDMSTMGLTYWGAAEEAFDMQEVIAPNWPVPSSYTDSTYIDLMYIDDAFPGPSHLATWLPDGADLISTLNPVKWARIPCIPPIVKPSINVLGDPFLYPANWVRSGETETVDVTVENLGNDILNVSSVNVVLDAGTPGGSVLAAPTSLVVDPADTAMVTVTINPGGMVNPSAGTAVIVAAEVEFHHDDIDRPTLIYRVNTVVADSVVQVVWDSIGTDAGYGLIVSNVGNGGRSGRGEVNLDFVRTGEECTADHDTIYTEDVYMYSMTPLVMQSQTNFSWNPFHDTYDPKAYNFQPVPNAIESESGSSSGLSQYRTGTFVTSDSAIGCTKTWATPTDGFTNPGEGFVVEKWELYSFDGLAHNDVVLGSWMDWDTPSDTGSNNFGGVVEADDYAYMRGLEYGEDETCHTSDVRFSASGLLGHYMSNAYTLDTSINTTGLNGAYVHLDDDIFEDGTDSLIVDSIWVWLNRGTFVPNNNEAADQQIMLSYGTFNIPVGDTLVIWTFHATIYNGTVSSLGILADEAKTWYRDNRADIGIFGCCGLYNGGLPGNVDFLPDGKMNLADITRLIDRVYVSKIPLDCEENGNVDTSTDGKINLADITKLIDVVYVSKIPPDPCL